MLRALLATAATAAVSSAAYYLYKSGKLDGPIDSAARRLGLRRPPALDAAYSGANASRPAPAHPWPVDPLALADTDMAAHAT
ncbi:MAG TPA: hypothetical protein VGE65_07545 [Sphingobium sp.]